MREVVAIRGWLALALAAVVVQEALTVYLDVDLGAHLLWGGVSLFLLFRIYRGARIARALFLILAMIGAGLYASRINSDRHALWLSVAYAVQAVVMLAPSVRGRRRYESETPMELPKAA